MPVPTGRRPGILPGLVDAHVHLGFDGGPDPVARMRSATDAELLILMLRSARELLGAGVTTARDLGARSFLDVTVRDAVASGMARGPRMLCAGRPITVTGGHCWFMGAECDNAQAVRTMVRLHHKMGVDVIKVMSTGGFMTIGSAPWFAQFTGDELAAGRAAAALGVDHLTGRVALGLEADIVAVGGDPRLDLAALSDLRLVLARGVPFVPDDLPPSARPSADPLQG